MSLDRAAPAAGLPSWMAAVQNVPIAYWTAIIAALVATYLASATTLAFFGDDWVALSVDPAIARLEIGVGRWLSHLIRELFGFGNFMPVVTLAIMAAGIVLAAIGIAALLSLRPNETALFGILLATSPFLIETSTFNVCHLNSTISCLLSVAALHVFVRAMDQSGFSSAAIAILLTSALLTSALATYQATALIFPAVLNYYILLHRDRLIPKAVPRLVLMAVATVMLTIVAYGLSVNLSWWISGIQALSHPNYNLSQGYASTTSLGSNLREVAKIWWDFALGHAHGFFDGPKFMLLAAWAVASGTFALAAIRKPSLASLYVIVAILGALLVPFLLLVARTTYPVRYNTLLVMSLVLVLPPLMWASLSASARVRTVLHTGAVLLIFTQILAHNIAAHGRALIFQRDVAIASRIVDRIETDAAATEWQKPVMLRIVGRLDMNTTALPFGDGAGPSPGQKYFRTSIAECSVFACQPDRFFNLVGLVQGGGQYQPHRGQLPEAQMAAVASAPTWPAAGSVTKIGDFWLVKLSN